MLNKNLLMSAITRKGDRATDLQKLLELTTTSIYSRMNGRLPFTAWEIERIYKHYDITPEELCAIFFNEDDEGWN